MREDTFTGDPDGAAGYERNRGGGYGPSEDRPSARDLADDAALNAQQRARREAAVAAGEYVPDLADAMAALSAQQRVVGFHFITHPHAPRVLRFEFHGREAPTVEAVQERLAGDFEVRESGGTLWARTTDAYAERLAQIGGGR